MKWYEIIDDLGDGSSAVRRFRTEEEAQAFLVYCENNDWGGPIPTEYLEVDTNEMGFFDEVPEEDEEF